MLNEQTLELMMDGILAMDLADNLKDPKEAQRYANEASATLARACAEIPSGQYHAYEEEAYKRLGKEQYAH